MKAIRIKMANDGNPADASRLQVFWIRADDQRWDEAKSAQRIIGNGGGWVEYLFDLSSHPQWHGTVKQIRVDPVRYGNGSWVGVDYIRFGYPRDFEFSLDGDSEGWTYHSIQERFGGPIGGRWNFSCPYSDPKLISPPLRVDANVVKTIRIKMANDGNPADASRVQVFWIRADDRGWNEAKSTQRIIGNGGDWAEYVFDLSSHSQWHGTVEQIRVDPVRYGNGSNVGVDYIRFE